MTIGSLAVSGTIIAFRGGLGVGKTTLAKGIAAGLGIDEEITSPTYNIVAEYEGRLSLRHIDAYRLSGLEDFEGIGGRELLVFDGICLVEWSERIEHALPAECAIIKLAIEADDSRSASVYGQALEDILP